MSDATLLEDKLKILTIGELHQLPDAELKELMEVQQNAAAEGRPLTADQLTNLKEIKKLLDEKEVQTCKNEITRMENQNKELDAEYTSAKGKYANETLQSFKTRLQARMNKLNNEMAENNRMILRYKKLIYLITNNVPLPEGYVRYDLVYPNMVHVAETEPNTKIKKYYEGLLDHRDRWIQEFNKQQQQQQGEGEGGSKSRRKAARKTRCKTKTNTHRRRHSRARKHKNNTYARRR